MFGERYRAAADYGLYFFLGKYDIPRKGLDHARQWESEEVYRFVLCAVCPVNKDYKPDSPECGFLYPAYKERGGAIDFADILYGEAHPEVLEILGVQLESGSFFLS